MRSAFIVPCKGIRSEKLRSADFRAKAPDPTDPSEAPEYSLRREVTDALARGVVFNGLGFCPQFGGGSYCDLVDSKGKQFYGFNAVCITMDFVVPVGGGGRVGQGRCLQCARRLHEVRWRLLL